MRRKAKPARRPNGRSGYEKIKKENMRLQTEVDRLRAERVAVEAKRKTDALDMLDRAVMQRFLQIMEKAKMPDDAALGGGHVVEGQLVHMVLLLGDLRKLASAISRQIPK